MHTRVYCTDSESTPESTLCNHCTANICVPGVLCRVSELTLSHHCPPVTYIHACRFFIYSYIYYISLQLYILLHLDSCILGSRAPHFTYRYNFFFSSFFHLWGILLHIHCRLLIFWGWIMNPLISRPCLLSPVIPSHLPFLPLISHSYLSSPIHTIFVGLYVLYRYDFHYISALIRWSW